MASTFPGRFMGLLRAVALAILIMPGAAGAHEYYADGFMIIHPWAAPTPPGAVDVPVYFHLAEITKGDRLIRGFSPLADRVEFRADDNPDRPALMEIAFGPGDSGDFGVGKPHVMLRGLKKPFEEGRSYMLMLEFEKAGQIVTVVSVGAD
ncbi:MAG: copper chaperone PCu(A)C [Herminiimonas sp.]|nr:copper chaperone PCu(A)C [Herminiimonas sp.]